MASASASAKTAWSATTMTVADSPGGRRTDASRPVIQRSGPPTSGNCIRSMSPGLQICPTPRFMMAATWGCRGSGRSGLLRQSEGPFAHNVALDLGGATPDGFRAGEEEERLEVVHRVVRLGSPPTRQLRVLPVVAEEDLALHAVDVHRQQQGCLVCLGPEHLVARAELGRGVCSIERVGERSEPVDLHDLDVGPRRGEALADEWISGALLLARHLENLVELLLES